MQRRVHVWGGGGGKGEGAQGEGKRGTEAGHPGREAKGGGEGGARGRAHLTGTPPFPSLRPRPLPLSLSPSSLHPPPPLRPPRAPPSSPPRPSPHAHTHTPHPHPPTHTHTRSLPKQNKTQEAPAPLLPPFLLPPFFRPLTPSFLLPPTTLRPEGREGGQAEEGSGGEREREREGRKPLPPFLASPFFPSPTRIRHTPSTYRAPRGLAGRRGRGEGGEREEEREGERGFPLSPSFPTRSPFAPPPFRTRLAPFLPPLSLRNLLLHPLQAVGSGALPSFLPSTHTRADRPPQTQIQSTGPPAGATRRPL